MGKIVIIRSVSFAGREPNENEIRMELENMRNFKSGRVYKEVAADWKRASEHELCKVPGPIFFLVRNSAAREFFSSDIFYGVRLEMSDRNSRRKVTKKLRGLQLNKKRIYNPYSFKGKRRCWWDGGKRNAQNREVIVKPDYIAILVDGRNCSIEPDQLDMVLRLGKEFNIKVRWFGTNIEVTPDQRDKYIRKWNKKKNKKKK